MQSLGFKSQEKQFNVEFLHEQVQQYKNLVACAENVGCRFSTLDHVTFLESLQQRERPELVRPFVSFVFQKMSPQQYLLFQFEFVKTQVEVVDVQQMLHECRYDSKSVLKLLGEETLCFADQNVQYQQQL